MSLDDAMAAASISGERIDEDRLEDFAGVFSLIDRQGTGQIL